MRARSASRGEAAKVQRWLDVIAALLRRSPGRCSFAELARDVPQYARGLRARGTRRYQEAAVTRMWERDKDELRALGVPIVLTADHDGNTRLYGLEEGDFYLPFVRCLGAPRPTPNRLARGLPTVEFNPDELAAVQRAARRVATLGDAALAEAAARALQTLAHDVAVVDVDDGETIVAPTLDAAVLRALGDALANGREVTCAYHSMARNAVRQRRVAPHGLVFLLGHWYCIATDPDDGAVKTFRVGRMRKVKAVGPTDIVRPPTGFRLAAHATSRQAWELGDGEQLDVRVRVQDAVADGALPGATLVTRGRRSRDMTMSVRRLQPFLRWMLAFAGDVRPVAPRPVVEAWRELVRRTAAAHDAETPAVAR